MKKQFLLACLLAIGAATYAQQKDFLKVTKYDATKNNLSVHISKNNKKHIKKGLVYPYTYLYFAEKDSLTQREFYQFNQEKGVYAKPFHLNGKLFTGSLECTRPDTSVIMQVSFWKGIRFGSFNTFNRQNEPVRTQHFGFVAGIPDSVKARFPEDRIDEQVVEKPIIYLYPTEKQDISLKVDFAGKLTHTYPKYNPQTGWNVVAEPSGTLLDKSTNLEYYALYWEGENTHQYDLSTGFVVRGEETAQFLDNTLKILGLNRREANEFIMFWLPQMENNAYNLIHFSQEEYTNLAKLDIQPKPETIIRVMMVFQPQENFVQITPQKLPATPIRTGFTVVEWGGTLQPKLEK